MKNATMAFTIATSFLFAGCVADPKKIAAGKVIEKIEKFQKENGRLPENLSEIGILEKEEGPVYYQKKDAESFIVWFGTSLGESKTYTSSDDSWH